MSLAVAESMSTCDYVGVSHSELLHHGDCCRLAREWLVAMHRSVTFERTDRQRIKAPIWLKNRYKWGPVQWPISWCEAVQRETVDCGVFAAFAREIFEASEYEVYPGQILLDQPESYTRQWNRQWSGVSRDFEWIGRKSVYHEVCAVAEPGSDRLRIFDPTEGVWLEPILETGINNVVGVNVRSSRLFDWGQLRVGLDQWQMY